jgi:hypothetical protein
VSTFRAQPSIVAEGESFELHWEAEGGTVSLAIKGEGPFVVGLPMSGFHVLSEGASGYPSGVGETTYEATVGDGAARAETTVTVQSNRPPSATVSCSPSTCHPPAGGSCSSTCTADASDEDGDDLTYAWSGCARGSERTAACTVNALSAFTATVNVSDGQASVTASAVVTGTNRAPTCTYPNYPRNFTNGNQRNVSFPTTDADSDARTCEAHIKDISPPALRFWFHTGANCNIASGNATSGTLSFEIRCPDGAVIGELQLTVDDGWTDYMCTAPISCNP